MAAPKTATPPAVKRSADARLYRYSQVEDGSADEQKRTLQLAFSSEFPVQRKAGKREVELGIVRNEGEKYLELLSHEEGDYDLTALNNDGALLDEHDERTQLGKVNRAEVSDDKKGRAVVEFDGITDLSKTRFAQMSKRSRPHVSFGYQQTGFVRDETLADGRTAKRVQWAADEISSVACPADPTVGSKRAEADYCHCTRCGGLFSREEVDDDFRCDDCGPVARSLRDNKTAKMTRAKADSSTQEFSVNALAEAVYALADKDTRFKGKDNKGNLTGWVSVRDIRAQSEEWFAIIYCGTDYKTYSVDLVFADDGTLSLGEAEEVKPNVHVTYDPVAEDKPIPAESAARTATEQSTRAVDSAKLPDAGLTRDSQSTQHQQPTKIMADNQITPELENQVRAKIEPTIRASIGEESKARSVKLSAAKKEIRAIADEHVKNSGMNWAGKPGEVVVVGERIRALADAAFESLESGTPENEVRNSFKTDCGELVRSSRAPKNQIEVANLPHELASRCSLGNLMRAAMKDSEKWRGSGTFLIADGAEFEADREIRHQAEQFPGGPQNLPAGNLLPMNMPSGVRSSTPVSRLKRDATAGDFATAGALISPEYIFPTIELLRNLPALSRAGMTILGGVQGNLVLPRQTAALTTSWQAEGQQLTASDQVFDQVRLDPHRIGSTQNYSRLALIQPSTDFEALVMADHMAQIALGIDYAGLNGTGTGDQPIGILNTLGIGSVTFGGSAANAYKNAVAMETAVRKANIYETGSYITTSASRGMLKSTAKLLVGATTVAANPVWDDSETIQGRAAWDSQQVPGDIGIYGVFRHLVMAQWGGLAVVLDTISKADKDQYKLTINTYVDFAARHAQAFCRTSDSLAVLS